MTTETAATVAAWAGVVTALATIGLVIAGWYAYKAANKSWKASTEANDQAKHDSIEQTRPYVYVEWLPSVAGEHTIDMRVTNSGRTSARNLRMECNDWPEPMDDLADGVLRMMKTARTLPPGCSFRNYWLIQTPQNTRMDGQEDPHHAGMGKLATVTVRYEGDPAQPPYEDQFTFDLDGWGLVPMPTEGPVVNGTPSPKQWYRLGQTVLGKLGELGR
ncbi:hypothetical protein [Arsenicicoccus bolidensis]|uniref:hypothetical protein n=1 Tax=Arsenicicoccus bolidensis TaxID=229480 RepID=UPI0012EBD31B|nr:hypothetical protein [Arsenicicoccus bolidensis]